ncbi:MAG: hypothetical protein QOH46_3933 [Solirubrobacteraceae bacterium]|jgi:uncharacterized membrane protein (DUF485 family)|nr:hypothetical protein [Solirubrobacteraceae bacterium]
MTAAQPVEPDARDQAPIDWERAAEAPEFRELLARRRRFVLTAATIALVWTFGFVLLTSYAHGFMGTFIVDGLTVGYVLGLSVFAMTWTLIWLYLRKARDEFEPLERRAAEAALRTAERPATDPPAERRTIPAEPTPTRSLR